MDINKICPGCMHEIQNRDNVSVCPDCGYEFNNNRTASHQLQPFTILAGKYLVGKVIGEGGFGISYIGIDLNLEKVVAIKEFYPNGFVTRESTHTTIVSMYSGKNEADVRKWREGFINEAKNLAKFSNLNGIVEVRDFFIENDTAYIVMEYIEGVTLKQYLKENGGKLSVEETFEMMEPVIRSLSKVHDAGMIHRDISPDNIMMTKHGGMKLLDFGAAREFSENAEKSLSIMLKPGYAPEEQYRSRGKQGPWSDVYALTATIYKCITGITPIESMERMREDTLKMPNEMGIKLTPEQENAMKNGMAVYAEKRIQNMDELYKLLYQKNKSQSKVSNPAPVSVAEPVSDDTPKVQPVNNLQIDKKMIYTGIAIFCGVFLVVLCGVLVSKLSTTGDKETIVVTNKLINDTGNEKNDKKRKEDTKVSDDFAKEDSSSNDIIKKINKIDAAILDYKDITQMENALDEYMNLAREYGYEENLGKAVFEAFNLYKNIILNRIQNCNNQEPSAALYTQIISDIERAYEYDEVFASYNIGVNTDEIEDMESSIRSNYKNRMISNFDTYAYNAINNNGAVSRSELWAKMEGVADTDLYDRSNPDDPLRLRYEAALTLNTLSVIENEPNLSVQIAKIYEVLIDTGYNPLLIYYLSSYGDSNAYDWYQEYLYLDGYYGFEYMNSAEMKNFVYYYATSSGYDYIRREFRNYMSREF